MNAKSKMILVLSAIALLCLVGWSSRAQSSGRTSWEYKVITVYGTSLTPPPNLTQFNEMGAQGWELVTVLSEGFERGEKRQVKIEYFFKRSSLSTR